ncbi:MAG: DUF4080 domain-containing protein [Desulfobulbaceae bacterium]|nr:DUF4080 domain-containing protein [Desulfobulbaceae bacterium]
MKISLIAFNARYTHSSPAIFYVRNVLEAALPEAAVTLQQLTINDPYYETLLKLTATRPDFFCFSVYIWNVGYVNKLLRDIGQVLPATPIILGGPEATFMDRAELPVGCTIVRGEVEGLGADFFADLKGGKLKPEYQAAAGRPFAMPYRAEDFDRFLANRNIYYESSRGCPFGCTYCLSSVARGVQNLELAQVEAELSVILAHQPNIIRFVDRTFNASAARALALWRFLLAQPGATTFHFEIAPDLFTEEMLDFLATVEPGRFQFEIGLQSTNPETLAAVNRTMDLDRARHNIERLLAADNIHLHLDLILGLPFEDKASFARSFNDVFAMRPHYVQMGLLKTLPGTAISKKKEEFGIISSGAAPYSVLATRWLDHSVMAELYLLGECVEAFYNNRFFRATFSYLRKQEENYFAFFAELLALCKRENFFELAKTQALMARILWRLADSRSDRELLVELLRYDWFRSGQHILPDFLEAASMKELKDQLWHRLPESVPPYFAKRDRREFFKRTIFYRFNKELYPEVGLESREGCLAFLAGPSVGVHNLKRTVFFAEDDWL